MTVSHCRLSEAAAASLSALLARHRSLQRLDLSHNQLGSGLQQLHRTILDGLVPASLRVLAVSDNGAPRGIVEQLKRALAAHRAAMAGVEGARVRAEATSLEGTVQTRKTMEQQLTRERILQGETVEPGERRQ